MVPPRGAAVAVKVVWKMYSSPRLWSAAAVVRSLRLEAGASGVSAEISARVAPSSAMTQMPVRSTSQPSRARSAAMASWSDGGGAASPASAGRLHTAAASAAAANSMSWVRARGLLFTERQCITPAAEAQARGGRPEGPAAGGESRAGGRAYVPGKGGGRRLPPSGRKGGGSLKEALGRGR